MIRRSLVAAAGALALVALVAGCSSDPRRGYALASSFRTDIRTVAVPVFANVTYDHGLESMLTDAIVKEIHRTTPWRVVSPSDADTVLRGSITDAALRKLTTSGDTGLVQEMAYQLTVTFEWKDNGSGEVLVARSNFRAGESFVPAQSAGERIETGRFAAVDQLASDIVAELRTSW